MPEFMAHSSSPPGAPLVFYLRKHPLPLPEPALRQSHLSALYLDLRAQVTTFSSAQCRLAFTRTPRLVLSHWSGPPDLRPR